MSQPILGIDFDNTIAHYGDLFVRLAEEAALFDPPFRGSRLELRARLRAREGGEAQWQALQAAAYGPRIGEATLSAGFLAFIDRARGAGAAVQIISHKTEFAAAAPEGPSLREAARGFLRDHDILAPDRLADADVSFAATRAAKLARVAELGCTHFIDDLPEVLDDPAFPANTRGILFDPTGAHTGRASARDWDQAWTLIFP